MGLPNRHARRAQAAKGLIPTGLNKGLASLQELSEVVAKIQPLLSEAAQLSRQLEVAREALSLAMEVNDGLRSELALQRRVFLHLIAQLSNTSLDEVLSMETILREQFSIAR